MAVVSTAAFLFYFIHGIAHCYYFTVIRVLKQVSVWYYLQVVFCRHLYATSEQGKMNAGSQSLKPWINIVQERRLME